MALTSTTPAPTTTTELDQILAQAAAASSSWAETGIPERAAALRTVADYLDQAAEELIGVAHEETHLPFARLRGELKRTTFQLRLFGDVVEEGSYLDARIDHADPSWGMGPRPEIRRGLEPIGPVLVFSASNFPFAFSVAGGDTASALAAGCPVIVKAHSGHPRLSLLTADIVASALADAGTPPGLFAVIFGTAQGRTALLDPRVKASSFTGSIPGGRALFDLANSRPEPIPFYGELGSVNPTFVTRSAARKRGAQIVTDFVDSFTAGAGQFCTKPGILLVPADSDIVSGLAAASFPEATLLLNDRIQAGYTDSLAALTAHPDVKPVVMGPAAYENPPAPTLVQTTAAHVLADPEALLTECFGPAALVVRYGEESELVEIAAIIDGQLTATVHGEEDDAVAPELIRLLARKAGRVLWNQWPTGVSVTYAQQHGGPYPATTAPTSTSVGTAAIFRFLRPVAYQGVPQHLLPRQLQDSNPMQITLRVDGHLSTPGTPE
ncbi:MULTISPECIES: aldehyde dehydrogenase (NADP(+)) [unclassified Pseudarthrobacter]|uniref:aldehyde dehydrogenase (NADP(+)) n=1 Tax=unclassified Pseudarthrobacter TaxID=2647000 RepID=UPI003076D39E